MQRVLNHWKVALLWLVSLVVVGVVVASAQERMFVTPTPKIVSGSDIGFRVDRIVDGVPQGAIVVRLDGKWVDVASGPILKPAIVVR